MSYEEARRDRRRKRRQGDTATLLALIQGLGQTLMRQKEIGTARKDALDKEKRDAEREAARDAARDQAQRERDAARFKHEKEIADIYSKGKKGGSTPQWVAAGKARITKWGKTAQEALDAIKRERERRRAEDIVPDYNDLDDDENRIREVMGLGLDEGSPDEPSDVRPGDGLPPQEPMDPIGTLLQSQNKPEVQPTNDQESNPSTVPGAPDPEMEKKREALRQLINARQQQRQNAVNVMPTTKPKRADIEQKLPWDSGSAAAMRGDPNLLQPMPNMLPPGAAPGMPPQLPMPSQQMLPVIEPSGRYPPPGVQPRDTETQILKAMMQGAARKSTAANQRDMLKPQKTSSQMIPATKQRIQEAMLRRQQGGPMAGGGPPISPAQAAYWRMGDAYRRFQAGDPTGWMELNELFGGILPAPAGMGLDTNYPRNRFSGLGTTTQPY